MSDRGPDVSGGVLRDPGSFRDPSGFVFHLGDEVFRTLDADCASLIAELDRSGLLDVLAHDNGLVATRVVHPGEVLFERLRRLLPRAAHFLQHERVPFISYPYEWSPSMLADAALCCLSLQLELIEHGYSLKDASAYNVQFAGGHPVFIDVASIERVRRRDVWTALNQFYRMFLYPLWLHVHKRGSLKEYFLGNLDGAELDEVYRRFGFFGAARPTLWLDLWLPYQLQRFMRGSAGKLRAKVEQDRGDSRPLAMNLERLKRKIDKLARLAHNTGRWTDYATDNSYRPSETERKEAFVRDFLDAHRPGRVLDLGCNTGRFSELASAFGADVVSVDSDPMCVDRLYRRARDRGSSILPLVIDLASPSPGMGFKNLERQSFLGRSSFDGVLALALVHHLLVTHRLPLEAIRDLLCDLTTGYLVVEFVEPQDPMFVSLLGARENLYKDLTPAAFVGVFERRFELISQAAVTPHRTIFRFRKRA